MVGVHVILNFAHECYFNFLWLLEKACAGDNSRFLDYTWHDDNFLYFGETQRIILFHHTYFNFDITNDVDYTQFCYQNVTIYYDK